MPYVYYVINTSFFFVDSLKVFFLALELYLYVTK